MILRLIFITLTVLCCSISSYESVPKTVLVMAEFKVTFTDIEGIAYVRSWYNSPREIKRSTGIKIGNTKRLERIKTKLLDAHDALLALSPTERQKYGGPMVNLKTIWERYLEDSGIEKVKDEVEVTDDVLFELSRFEQTQTVNAPGFNRGARQVHMHLSYFCRREGYNELRFRDLTRPFLKSYESFLLNEKAEYVWNGEIVKKKKLSTATVKKHFTFIKAAATWAAGEVDVNQAALAFKRKNPEVNEETESLDYQELTKLLLYEPESNEEELTRDIWMFMSFSGLRVSKAQELRPNDIRSGFIHWDNGKGKSVRLVRTTIHRFNAPYIQKYKQKSGTLFPYIAQQEMNVLIKGICRKVGIEKADEITCHSARHTYNNLMRKLPISDFDRREEMGHAHPDINSKAYGKDDYERRKRNMIGIFENLESHLHEDNESEVGLYDAL